MAIRSPDAAGNFSASFAVPALATAGAHTISTQNGVGNLESSRFTVGASCDVIGQVTEVHGQAEILQADGTWAPLLIGTAVRQFDTVRTLDNGGLVLLMADNTTLELTRNTQIRLDEFAYEPSTGEGSALVKAVQGLFNWTSGLINDNGNRNIDNPVGVVGIRGTRFVARYDALTETEHVHLIEDTVSVTPRNTGVPALFTAPISIAFGANGPITTSPLVDTDGDGVSDAGDNCALLPNADQRDTNGDGFGNRCDADFNGNGTVDSQDGALQRAAFGLGGFPDRDLNGNGIVDSQDGAVLRARFGQPPGPSGFVP